MVHDCKYRADKIVDANSHGALLTRHLYTADESAPSDVVHVAQAPPQLLGCYRYLDHSAGRGGLLDGGCSTLPEQGKDSAARMASSWRRANEAVILSATP